MNIEEKKKLMDCVKEMSNSYLRIEAERSLLKEMVDIFCEDCEGVNKKTLRKIARTYHKGSFSKDVSEQEQFQEIYEELGLDE